MRWWRGLRKGSAAPAHVDSLGPVFISYRDSDGRQLAVDMAWALRYNGVPVWHDVADMPPGETAGRLREALTSGLSGAVLVVTPELKDSSIVRTVELPELLVLAQDGNFILGIANTIKDHSAAMDFAAPDLILRQKGGPLARLKHYAVDTPEQRQKLAHEIALQRMAILRRRGDDQLVLDIQTRSVPRATTPHHALVFRTHPPTDGQRLPPASIWAHVKEFLADLPKLVAEAGASSVEVRGGAHLSIAFAMGAALPETTQWPITVVDQFGGAWASDGGSDESPALVWETTEGTAGGPVGVYVDLVPTAAPNAAFAEHAAAAGYSLSVHVSSRDRLDPHAAHATTAKVAEGIRNAAAQAQTNKVALFLRCPFAVALLLGRLFNTLEVEVFELDDTTALPQYRSVAVIASGHGGGPIAQITAQDSSGAMP